MLRWTGIDGKGATMEGNTDAFRLNAGCRTWTI